MTWDNRSEWHVDHIVPISITQTIDEVKYLNHHTNLRPLWVKDNISKGDRIDESNVDLYNKFLKEMRNIYILNPSDDSIVGLTLTLQ